jgi:hypothetical protein
MNEPNIKELTDKIKSVRTRLQALITMHAGSCPARFVGSTDHCLCGARRNNNAIRDIIAELDK